MTFHRWLALLYAAGACHALSTEEWQKQSIYSLLTDRFATSDSSVDTSAECDARQYCGGTWKGIKDNLDYIQGMGFTAIWISPIVENIEPTEELGAPYHGYWPKNLWGLNPNFGTEDDLKDLSHAVHKRGMYIMLDVVANHMAWGGSFNTTDWSSLNPFNQSKYFHSPCWPSDDNKTSVQVCMTGDQSNQNSVILPDLRTEDADVRQIFQSWIKTIVDKYNFDGLRLDSAKHVEPDFWPGFLDAAGVFAISEYYDGDPKTYPSVIETVPGAVNYPLYYWLTRAFQSSSSALDELIKGIKTMKGLMKTSTLAPFLENHDQERFAGLTGDMALIKNAIGFTILMDGIPIIYQGQEQRFSGLWDPYNREPLWSSGYDTDAQVYQWIKLLNAIRSYVIGDDPSFVPYQAEPVWSTIGAATNKTQVVAMKKGDLVSVFTNIGLGGAVSNVSIPASATQYVADKAYVDAVSCEVFTAASNGALTFEIGAAPRIFYPATGLKESGICGDGPRDVEPTCLVTFDVTVSTDLGQSVKLLGDIPQLGSGNWHQALSLDSSHYTSDNPLWTVTVELPPSTEVSSRFFKVDGSANLEWESTDGGKDGSLVHTFTVPDSCDSTETILAPAATWSGKSSNAKRRSRIVRRSLSGSSLWR